MTQKSHGYASGLPVGYNALIDECPGASLSLVANASSVAAACDSFLGSKPSDPFNMLLNQSTLSSTYMFHSVRQAHGVLLAGALLAFAVLLPRNPCCVFAQEKEATPIESPWLVMPGNPAKLPDGVSKPKKVVLISGDEEYRSEEALPMLAKILSEQHGFDTVVLFSINPETGTVDPNYQKNIPGLENLRDADVAIFFIRFRQLPDEQMQHIADFAKRGGAMIALRTATHPFNFPANSKSPFASWSWNSKSWPGGFGQQLLGETWHSHHGKHKSESARGVIPEAAKANPILRGVNDLWAPSDVYGVVHLPPSANVLVRGQVLKGMKPDDAPVEDGRNEPMMPVVWTKDYQLEDGKPGKVFCSTMCSAIDLLSEDLRRLIVNATYWAADLEAKIPEKSSVAISENYKPSMFGFQKDPNFFKDQKIQPKDYVR